MTKKVENGLDILRRCVTMNPVNSMRRREASGTMSSHEDFYSIDEEVLVSLSSYRVRPAKVLGMGCGEVRVQFVTGKAQWVPLEDVKRVEALTPLSQTSQI
jgi:hypothetical protein